MADQLSRQPPSTSSFILSYPAQYVLLVTINRPEAMNSIPSYAHWEAESLFTWFDQEPSLRVAVITGAGAKAFCAGQDLIEQAQFKVKPPPVSAARHPPLWLLRHKQKGGQETHYRCRKWLCSRWRIRDLFKLVMLLLWPSTGTFTITDTSSDMVVASPKASFGLPEATVGLYAAAGGLPRIVRNCGLQIASEVAMTGRRLSPQEVRTLDKF